MMASPLASPRAGVASLIARLVRLAERLTQVSLQNRIAGREPQYGPEVFALCSLALLGVHFQVQECPEHDLAAWQARCAFAIHAAEAELHRVQPNGPVETLPSLDPPPCVMALPPALPFVLRGGVHGQ
jgi:hypothetical protein